MKTSLYDSIFWSYVPISYFTPTGSKARNDRVGNTNNWLWSKLKLLNTIITPCGYNDTSMKQPLRRYFKSMLSFWTIISLFRKSSNITFTACMRKKKHKAITKVNRWLTFLVQTGDVFKEKQSWIYTNFTENLLNISYFLKSAKSCKILRHDSIE